MDEREQEVLGADVVEAALQGLVAIHLRHRRGVPIFLLRSLAGRMDAEPLRFNPLELVDGQATIQPGRPCARSTSTQFFSACSRSRA
ncbi:hypothetical protein ABZ897_26510 [Nonomuraea sp. NPDC046802]|uniref:hypothetical protein n=1 Tax=Nonomuraea sp. NPDC046802 TaxID=3154919 RepID=UPI0033D98ECF